ncbi:MAG: CHASE2 domain-containing protein [Gemmatimonadetes bacterium]|nr:MAG: CHASE2 domain-containing protein [Gemmatimonadota bacterium]
MTRNKYQWKTMLLSRLLIIVGVLIFTVLTSRTPLMDSFNNQVYDELMRWRGNIPVHPDIVLVFIGDDATETLGEWPLTRDFYALFLDAMRTAGAKTVVFDLLMSNPSPFPEYDQELIRYTQEMGNVYYPYFFQNVNVIAPNTDDLSPPNLMTFAKPFNFPDSDRFYTASSVIFPLPALAEHAKGLGHVNVVPDADGVTRQLPLFINYQGQSYPSLALVVALDYKQQTWAEANIPLDPEGMLAINYCGGLDTIPNYSFLQVLGSYRQVIEGETPLIPLDTFRDKLVLVGMTATGATDLNPTPFSPNYPLVGTLANVINSILQDDYLYPVPWGVHLVLIGLIGVFFFFGIPHIRELWIFLIPFGLLAGFVGIAWLSFKLFNLYWHYMVMTNGIVFNAIALWVWTVRNVEVERRRIHGELLQRTEKLLLSEQRLQGLTTEIQTLEETIETLHDYQVEAEEYHRLLEKTEAERMSLLAERDRLLSEKQKLEAERKSLHEKIQPHPTPKRTSLTANIKKRAELKGDYHAIIGQSPAMLEILYKLDKVAQSDASVLLFGESGTGKELIARAIHENSPRRDKNYVTVNCAAIPRELIESELFGHEKGAFTGAINRRLGKFELAHQGTIFLDEIGDMDVRMQAKLLRAIQEREFMRVGGSELIQVDVRIIAATNRDLPAEIEKGNFREDLYHRLNVVPFYLPPLRARREDIPLLIDHFLTLKGFPQVKITPEAMQALQRYSWKGNIRELGQVIERMLVLKESDTLTLDDVPVLIRDYQPSTEEWIPSSPKSELPEMEAGQSLKELVEAYERKVIVKALHKHNWNKSRTAEFLGIGRRNLHQKINKYNIIDGETP